MGRPGCPSSPRLSPPSKMEGEDAEDLANPNLVYLTFCDKYFPNFGSLRVHDFWTIQKISCIQLGLGRPGNPLRDLVPMIKTSRRENLEDIGYFYIVLNWLNLPGGRRVLVACCWYESSRNVDELTQKGSHKYIKGFFFFHIAFFLTITEFRDMGFITVTC